MAQGLAYPRALKVEEPGIGLGFKSRKGDSFFALQPRSTLHSATSHSQVMLQDLQPSNNETNPLWRSG